MTNHISAHLKTKSVCARMADPMALSKTQARDLETGVAAVEAFWEAARTDVRFSLVRANLYHSCILAALCVRDILHVMGRTEAKVVKYGLVVRRASSIPMQELVIGLPGEPRIENGWNAHLVARLGDVIIDPTFGQTKRAWNNSPQAVVSLLAGPAMRRAASQRVRFDAQSYHAYAHELSEYEFSYFKLAPSVDAQTREWLSAPDADSERRKPLVSAACELLVQSD